MAYPTWTRYVTTTGSTLTSPITRAWSTIISGESVSDLSGYLIVAVAGGEGVTSVSGFTLSSGPSGNPVNFWIRECDGTESGSITIEGSLAYGVHFYAIPPGVWSGDVATGVTFSSIVAGNDPPEITIPWGTEDTLVIVGYGTSTDNVGISGYSDFTDGLASVFNPVTNNWDSSMFSAVAEVNETAWDPATLSGGSGGQVGLVAIRPGGGSPDRTGEVSFTELEVPVFDKYLHVSHAELETPEDPRTGEVSFTELEVPVFDKGVQVSFGEFELPDFNKSGEVSFTELEVPVFDKGVQVSFGEFETPDAPQSGVVSFAELETPDEPRTAEVAFAALETLDFDKGSQISHAVLETPEDPRTGEVSFTELETPDEPRTGQYSYAELEVPVFDKEAQVSFTELETPDEPRTGDFSFAELEVPVFDKEAQVSYAALETPDDPRTGEFSYAEFEVPAEPRTVQVSWATAEIPEPAAAWISWAEFQVPNTLFAYLGSFTFQVGTHNVEPGSDTGWNVEWSVVRSRPLGFNRDRILKMGRGSAMRSFVVQMPPASFTSLQVLQGKWVNFVDWYGDKRRVYVLTVRRENGSRPFRTRVSIELVEQLH